MKRPFFKENCIVHVYNRGVDKRTVFLDDGDYIRFIHYLFVLNDKKQDINLGRKLIMKEVEPPSLKKPRELLVEILAFVLMPNHYHLLLKQKSENGITKFMQKIGTGYTMFFNEKYPRTGSLFQGRFKSKLVDKNEYLIHLLNYIHFNPLELFNEGGSTSFILRDYRWGSFMDYIGEKNFPSVTSRGFMLNIFGSEEKYKKAAEEWLKEKDKNISLIASLTIQ